MRIEVTIHTDLARGNKEEVEDALVWALARVGYAPYITDSGIAYTCDKEESIEDIK